METFYTRVNKWYRDGFRVLASCSKWGDGTVLTRARSALRQHGIEYHNVKNSAGRSIYVKQIDLVHARQITGLQ